ncbi:MAG: hypothetical protein IIV02_00600 [Peptococcaceae bacterium]|jgi:hypothetical protein|nr:hypothetical protein [Peptococcaceae bacterium]MBQ5658010.1 hypothetical protein [Peptococcaceae bacterium]
MKRNLDGVYFRVKRDEKWENICFTDLTQDERHRILEGKSNEWLKSMVLHLANIIEDIGELMDIVRGDE